MTTNLEKNEIEQLLNNLPGMLYRCRYDEHWTMEFVSDGCEELTGYEKKELLLNKKIAYADLMHKDDYGWTFEEVTEALEEKSTFSYEYRITHKNGKIKWVWEQGIGIYDDEGNVLFIEGFITDITKKKKEKEKLRKEISKKEKEILINHSLLNEYKKAVDASAIVTKTDKEGIITYVNDEFCKISGFSREDSIGKNHNIVRDPKTPPEIYEELWNTILDKRIWKGVMKNRSKSGKSYYVKSTIVPILDVNSDIKEFMAIRHDVTDLVLQEKKIRFQTTDLLTGLSNRQKLLEDLLEDRQFKLAILNIERFKEINEYYGFDVGDRLLVELSNILAKKISSFQLRLYKLSGDEFAILGDDTTAKDEFISLIQEILSAIKLHEFPINEHKLKIRMLSGITMMKNYFINAEMATNHAKLVKEDILFFDEHADIKDNLINNINWTHKIREALNEDRVEVFAQPIICNNSKCIEKYECLVRIIEKDGSIIAPFHFLQIAKKSKLYPEITRTVISKAFSHFEKREDNFSINLSLEDILDSETIDFLQKQIESHKGIGERLIIEIVEDEGIENYQDVSNFIESMRFLGCKIAIDDFGTGYSNFDYLMKLNVDYIKIDGSIIKNIDQDKNAKIVTELIVDFAKRLNIETIGEYVHSESVLSTIINMGVDYSQGFLLGKPEKIQN